MATKKIKQNVKISHTGHWETGKFVPTPKPKVVKAKPTSTPKRDDTFDQLG